jgi:hypothetical protein
LDRLAERAFATADPGLTIVTAGLRSQLLNPA